MAKYLKNSLVLFAISEFLPGEDVLCTFPLICKVTQLLRFSLSLRRPISTFDFESLIATIIGRGHLITALCLEEDNTFQFQSNFEANNNNHPRINNINQHRSKNNNSNLKTNTIPTFSSVRFLKLRFLKPSFSSIHLSLPHSFPKLTELVVWNVEDGVADQLLSEIWKLSTLTSLKLSESTVDVDIAKQHTRGDFGPPAFAQSLSSVETGGENCDVLLDLLSPYCFHLRHISANNYHKIMISNPRLTSLNLTNSFSDDFFPSSVDLTPHHQLIELHISSSRQFTSATMHVSLEKIMLSNPSVDCARDFLPQCPAVKELTLDTQNWQAIVEIISVLNPNQCKQLQLDICSPKKSRLPLLSEVNKRILQKGFKVNDSFLLQTRDAPQRWRSILQLAPNIVQLETLSGLHPLDHFFQHQRHHPHLLPSFFSSFQTLSVMFLSTAIDMNHETLSCIAQSCSALHTLRVFARKFSGILELQSPSLRKVELTFYTEFSGFHLNLPNLRRLNLRLYGGEGILLQGILDGDNPRIQLPLLRVLDLTLNQEYASSLGSVASILCKVGHTELTEVKIAGKRVVEMEKITFQHVPSLRKLILKSLPPTTRVVLDIPGTCDVFIAETMINVSEQEAHSYLHKGCYNGVLGNFTAQIHFRDEEWVENVGVHGNSQTRSSTTTTATSSTTITASSTTATTASSATTTTSSATTTTTTTEPITGATLEARAAATKKSVNILIASIFVAIAAALLLYFI